MRPGNPTLEARPIKVLLPTSGETGAEPLAADKRKVRAMHALASHFQGCGKSPAPAQPTGGRSFGIRFRSCVQAACFIWTAGLLIGLLGPLPFLRSDEIVYDNTRTFLNAYRVDTNRFGPAEFGDEINLAGRARVVTQFLFEMFGDFTPHGDETVTLRFYANDGPHYPNTTQSIYLPGTVLYDSGPFQILPGYKTYGLDLPQVRVPDTFTFTISVTGLTQTPRDSAGLLLYNPPTIGAPLAGSKIGSYNDYWRYTGETWALRTSAAFTMNFGARVIADGPNLRAAKLGLDASSFTFRWVGNIGAVYRVERSDDLKQWTYLGLARTAPDGEVSFTDPLGRTGPMRFYRTLRLNRPLELTQVAADADPRHQEYQVRWRGSPGARYRVQASEDLIIWKDLAILTAGLDGAIMYLDAEAAGRPRHFYRALPAVEEMPVSRLQALRSPFGSTASPCVLRWQADPESLFEVQASTDFLLWSTAGFARADSSGRIEFEDPDQRKFSKRFYRARAIDLAQRTSARLRSVPDLQRGRFQLAADAGLNETYEILASTDLRQWFSLGRVETGDGGQISFVDVEAAKFTKRFYRAVRVQSPPQQPAGAVQLDPEPDTEAGVFRMAWDSSPSQVFAVQASTDLQSWTTIGTAQATVAGQARFDDYEAFRYSKRFYRALATDARRDPAPRPGLPTRRQGKFTGRWQGNPDVLYQIQASSDFLTWIDTSTVRAGADGWLSYTDTDIQRHPRRFYRAVRVPQVQSSSRLATAADLAYGRFHVVWQAEADVRYQVQASSDLEHWVPLDLVRASLDGRVDFVDMEAGKHSRQFYRAVRLDSLGEAPRLTAIPDIPNRLFRLQWQGRPNTLYTIEMSRSLFFWDLVGAVRTDATGHAEFVDRNIGTDRSRTYRLVLP